MIVVVRNREQREKSRKNIDSRILAGRFEHHDTVTGQTSLGEKVTLEDVEVSTNPNFLKYESSKYLAWELTPGCNVACGTCYNWSNTFSSDVGYASIEFAKEFAKALGDNPYIGRTREIVLSGGEPTIEIGRLEEISQIFAGLGGNNHIIITSNGVAMPLEEDELREFFSRFDVTWQISYNSVLKGQYERLRDNTEKKYQIPNSENPALDKLELLMKVGNEVGANVVVRVMENNNDPVPLLEEVQERVGRNGIYSCKTLKIGSAKRNNGATVPKQGYEKNREEILHIGSQGIVYPSVHHYGTNVQIGTLLKI